MTEALVMTLDDATLRRIAAPLQATNLAFAAQFLGDSSLPQPVHTVYGGAHLFRADVATKLGAAALRALDEYAPDGATLVRALGITASDPDALRERVRAKLSRAPVEDYRVDFEDGYGQRSDDEEDGHALSAAREMARGVREGVLPRGVGIRMKSLGESTRRRALRTLDVFLTALCVETNGSVPEGFVVTLPKATAAEQITALVDAIELLESRLGVARGAIRVEFMVETPQALIDARGTVALPRFVQAARGRCTSAHFGTYDYTASLGIAAPAQGMRHPACDFARGIMQICLAGTGVRVSDGATSVLPIAPHRARDGQALDGPARDENTRAVHSAWALHAANVADSLHRGIYQGWDLHPAQFVARYAVVYEFFERATAQSAARLRNFVERAGQATRVGTEFDDAATGQGLLNVFIRALDCGALDEARVLAMTGIPSDALRTRSFPAIVAGQLPR